LRVILAATNKWKGGLQAGAGRKPPRLFTLVETHEKQMTAKTANGVPYRGSKSLRGFIREFRGLRQVNQNERTICGTAVFLTF
jgi:hypothetical protein